MSETGPQTDRNHAEAPTLGERARTAGWSLAILAVILVAVYYLLGWWFTPVIVAVLVLAIVLPLAFPYRYEDLVSALIWLGIAALAWFYFGAQPLAVIAGVIDSRLPDVYTRAGAQARIASYYATVGIDP